ncbi:MAG: hypothetical protein NZX77_19485, partial [Polyangiaceae bacterium]|nr:hypothetical protein [Polyangiaceae bacterium]
MAVAVPLVLACGTASLAPVPPPVPPVEIFQEDPPALSALASATPPEASQPESLRPYQGAFLADDAAKAFPERAILAQTTSLRLRRDSPENTSERIRKWLSPRTVIVVENTPDFLRFVLELAEVRLLLWAAHDDFLQVPVKATCLALRPGIYPQGPPSDPDRDGVGVWV